MKLQCNDKAGRNPKAGLYGKRKRREQVIVPRCKPFNARLIRFVQSVLDVNWSTLPSYAEVLKPSGAWYSLRVQPLPEIVQMQEHFDSIPMKRFTRLGYKKSTFAPIKNMQPADALDFIKRHL